ncbi:MAG TPA: hypothetical protein PLJ35_12905 [Anaerolineae bacterium]|nr:hypothetical protein [Anaerolineae bacterium]HOQ99712.1 hypothetical protein [Anaerolineae bacterium]HPL26631.1 hypothetical protein [Anaerolineae bacterium]
MKRSGRRHASWLVGLAGALVLSGLLVVAGLSAGRARAEVQGAPATAEASAILAQPRGYLFRSVVVRGEVIRLWGRRALALRCHSVRQGLLIVLSEHAAEAGLRAGQTVDVSGSVRSVSRKELQALDHGRGVDADSGRLLARYGGDPYILADEVQPAGGDAPHD